MFRLPSEEPRSLVELKLYFYRPFPIPVCKNFKAEDGEEEPERAKVLSQGYLAKRYGFLAPGPEARAPSNAIVFTPG